MGRRRYGPPYQTRIEPDLGVPVLTTAGYLAKEADRNGTSIEEEAADYEAILQEMEAEVLGEWHNPAHVLAVAREWLTDLNRGDLEYHERTGRARGENPPVLVPLPRRIVEILEVSGGASFRGHNVRVRALAIREHGQRDVLHLTDSYDRGGSYYDPPDGESEVWWESQHPDGAA